MNSSSAASFILQSFFSILHLNEDETEFIGEKFPIPKFQNDVLLSLCDEFLNEMDQMKNKTQLVTIESSCFVVGDLHGNRFDHLPLAAGGIIDLCRRFPGGVKSHH